MSWMQEAMSQWVWAYGAERPDEAWILSDYDTWHRNPHYTGPEQRHPEDYGFDEDDEQRDYGDGVDDPNYVVTGCEDRCDDDFVDEDIPF